MEWVAEPGLFGDLLHQGARLLQPFGSEGHLQSHQKLVRTLVVVAPEQPAKISGVHVAFTGDLPERPELAEMLLDVLPALPVGRERERFHAGERRARFGDFQNQAFQQFGAQCRALPRTALAAPYQFVKDVLYFVGRKNP